MLKRNPKGTLLGLLLLAALFAIAHLSLGSSQLISVRDVVAELVRGPQSLSDMNNGLVWQIRMPRMLECLLVGGILGAVGSVFQALLRNPLADPYVVGVSSGAAVGGSLALVAGFGTAFGNLGQAGAGFVTGIFTLALIYRLAYSRGAVDVRTLLLAGVVIGSLLSSVLSMVLLTAGKNEADVLHWLLGDTSTANWPKVSVLTVALFVGFGLLAAESKRLNAFAIGEDAARHLGVDVKRLTRLILLVGGGMVAAAVGAVGIIGFLGLAAPHIARRLVGVDWRWSLPGSLAVGALLLVAADMIAQRFFSVVTNTPGMDIPVGIVTSVLGAPSLLILLRKAQA